MIFRNNEKGFLEIIIIFLVICFAAIFILIFAFSMRESGNLKKGNSDQTWAGSDDVTAELNGLTMPATEGKLGSEDHMTNFYNRTECFISGHRHYEDPFGLSEPLDIKHFTRNNADASCGSYHPRTMEQEAYYFNMRWPSGKFAHKKVIITNPKNGKRVVASIEEYGPGVRVTLRDGINCGASPEVRNYLQIEDPYTGNPNDKKGFVTFGFAKDQNIPLGPLNKDSDTDGSNTNQPTSSDLDTRYTIL